MTLNVEEMILMQQLKPTTRGATIQEITHTMKLVDDADLLGLYRQLGSKLRAMSDQEFAAIDFTVYEEDAHEK